MSQQVTPPLPPPPGSPAKKPIWRRWWFWVAVVVFLAGIAAALSGDASKKSAEDASPSEATSRSEATSPSEATCPEVAQGWEQMLDMRPGTYVYADGGTASNGHPAWVVQRKDGAVWATDVDPSGRPQSGGLVVPLNDQARQDSDLGADLTDTQIAGLFPDASVDAVSACG